jgi:E3 ubiquitin-protein ligase HUWE1
VTDLKNNTDYVNYTKESEVIKWFWEVLESFTPEKKANFIQFVTGTSKVPLEGFKSLKGIGGQVQRFQIHKVYNEKLLPTSHTCLNQLELPEYTSKEQMKRSLEIVLELGTEGFGFV